MHAQIIGTLLRNGILLLVTFVATSGDSTVDSKSNNRPLHRLPTVNLHRLPTVNLSHIISSIMKEYDKHIIPSGNNNGPLNLSVGVYVVDMVPLEILNMHFSLDIYFRQYWQDTRLAYKHLVQSQTNGTQAAVNYDSIILDSNFVDKVWRPDLYFRLTKKGSRSTLTRPNELIRLKPDGNLFYSQRLHLTVFCKMELFDFPFDRQVCEFPIESYSYSKSYMLLNWAEIIPPQFTNMLEFTFDRYTYKSKTNNYFGKDYTELVVYFHFSRNINYYLLQIYLPCALIVILSWVGFWIDYRSTPARVALGITTVLTMITFSTSVRSSLPFVNYTRLIDVYLLVCFVNVFMALVEFATVGITDQKWKKKLENITSNVFGKPKDENTNQQSRRKESQTLSVLSMESILEEDTFSINNNGFISTETTPRDFSPTGAETTRSIDSTSFTFSSNNSNGSTVVRNGIKEVNGAHLQYDINNNSILPSPRMDFENGRNNDHVLNMHIMDGGAIKRKTGKENPSISNTPNENTAKKSRPLNQIKKTKRRVSRRLFEEQKKCREIHVIDRISRVLYPLTFLLFNLIYFLYAYIRKSNNE